MDYHVKSLGKTCAATGEPLEPGTLCHSVLIEQDGEQRRIDYAANAWPSEPPAGTIAHWVTTVPAPDNPDRPKPLDPEELFQFFEQILEDMNPAQEKIKYVLSLLLMQKKRLRLEGSRQDGDVSYLQLIGSQGEGPFEIRDQNLSDDEIAELQQELNAAIYR